MDRRLFVVPEQILSQSPVLEQICAEIDPASVVALPAISATGFELVLEYLYSHDLAKIGLGDGTGMARRLAELYISATGLMLNLLVNKIIEKLGSLGLCSEHQKSLLFELADTIYANTPAADRVFKDFFITSLVFDLKRSDPWPQGSADQLLARGGQLAIDITQAHRMRNELLTRERRKLLHTWCFILYIDVAIGDVANETKGRKKHSYRVRPHYSSTETLSNGTDCVLRPLTISANFPIQTDSQNDH